LFLALFELISFKDKKYQKLLKLKCIQDISLQVVLEKGLIKELSDFTF